MAASVDGISRMLREQDKAQLLPHAAASSFRIVG
jgi:hypothetical protein